MHSDTPDKSGSPRKRILSRAASEDESLRNIIQEAEETSKRLTRRDSKYGSFRRESTRGSQSEEESVENMPMVELQEDYEACLAELKAVERHQDVLLFQLDCLHDALEGTEEALYEAQRENQQISMELEKEREQRRALESTVASLMKEVEKLKEEKNSVPEGTTCDGMADVTETDGKMSEEPDPEPVSPVLQSAAPAGSPPGSPEGSVVRSPTASPGAIAGFATGSAALAFLSLFSKNRRSESSPSSPSSPAPPELIPHPALEGSSVDQEVKDQVDHPDQPRVGNREENDESSGYEDAPSDFSPGSSTPDGASDLPADDEGGVKGNGLQNPEPCVMS